MKRVIRIFGKDALIATRDSMLMYIIIIPVIIAVGILFLAPGITDSSVTLALLEGDAPEHIAYMKNYVQVELFSSPAELERRVNKPDAVAGLLPKDGGYEIVVQGNEDEMILDYAKMMNTLYSLGVTRENTTAQILSFERKVPPLKTKLVNMLILMIIMLSGMIISLGIVEEKSDQTIHAVNVTPVSQNAFIVGKCLLGGVTALVSIVLSLIITGYTNVNWLMIILVGVTSMILAFVVGFLQGLGSDDVIEAAAGVKMTMLPIAGSIAGYEFLSESWQWTMYWSPFYWAYKANNLILTGNADWGTVLLCVAAVTALSLLVYVVAIPGIRKGLG